MTHIAFGFAKFQAVRNINPIRHRRALRGGPERFSVPSTLLTTVMNYVHCAGVSSSPWAANACANGIRRGQNHSTELLDCRAYEKTVRSRYEEGFAVALGCFSDGGIVSYSLVGNFADAVQGSGAHQHRVTRSAAGWITTTPSSSGETYSTGVSSAAVESAHLRSSLWVRRPRDSRAIDPYTYLRNPAGDFVHVGRSVTSGCRGHSAGVAGNSTDLSHIVYQFGAAGSAAAPEYVGVESGGSRPVSDNDYGNGTPPQTCPNGTLSDGRAIVFASGLRVAKPQEVWARVAGSATMAVAGSECTPAAGRPGGVCSGVARAEYAGPVGDRSAAFLTASQQLVNGDTGTGNCLYACDIPPSSPSPVGSASWGAALAQVFGTASNAQVDGVLAVSGGASRVYLVAQGVLAGNLAVGDHVAVVGANDLSRWERDDAYPAGHMRFPGGLAADDLTRAQMTVEGRYMTFLTSSALAATGHAADIDGARDVYRYDSLTDAMVQASASTSGDGRCNGVSGAGASVTAVGASVVFNMSEAVSLSDADGVSDVYVGHGGQVSLISSGGANVLCNSLCECTDGFRGQCSVKLMSAISPLLRTSMNGKVGLAKRLGTDPKVGRQFRTLPALLIGLRGELAVSLRETNSAPDSRHWTLTFPIIPDASISSFSMRRKGGKKGISAIAEGNNNNDLALQKRILAAQARNGKRIGTTTTMTVECSLAVFFTRSEAKRKSGPAGASHARHAVASCVWGRS